MAIDLTDKSGNGNTLTNNGAIEVITALPFTTSTRAIDLESTESDHLSIIDANQTGLDFSTTFTIEFWVKSESQPETNTIRYLIGKDGISDNRGYGLFYRDISGTKYIDANVFDSLVNSDQYRWPVTLTDATWVHIALTCNTGNVSATTFELFINGVSQGNGSGVVGHDIATINNTVGALTIGTTGENTLYFDGQLDDIRLWNDVRTSTEISTNKSRLLTGAESNLVAYWPFEALPSSGFLAFM